MFSPNSVAYVREEIKYGTSLYISGWKKLLLHPLQTLQDTFYAVSHPLQTTRILVNELKQHPIGMAVNVGLSWLTGRAISSSIRYWRAINLNNADAHSSLMQNSSAIPESALSSVSQAVQMGTQAMSGGCCGGICTTTAARLGQTTSLITSQSVSTHQQTLVSAQPSENDANKGFSPHFNALQDLKKAKSCEDVSCSSKKSASSTPKINRTKLL